MLRVCFAARRSAENWIRIRAAEVFPSSVLTLRITTTCLGLITHVPHLGWWPTCSGRGTSRWCLALCLSIDCSCVLAHSPQQRWSIRAVEPFLNVRFGTSEFPVSRLALQLDERGQDDERGRLLAESHCNAQGRRRRCCDVGGHPSCAGSSMYLNK
jgi:hypothetical protein